MLDRATGLKTTFLPVSRHRRFLSACKLGIFGSLNNREILKIRIFIRRPQRSGSLTIEFNTFAIPFLSSEDDLGSAMHHSALSQEDASQCYFSPVICHKARRLYIPLALAETSGCTFHRIAQLAKVA